MGIKKIVYVDPSEQIAEQEQERLDRVISLQYAEGEKSYEYLPKPNQAEMDYIEQTYRKQRVETRVKSEQLKRMESESDKNRRSERGSKRRSSKRRGSKRKSKKKK